MSNANRSIMRRMVKEKEGPLNIILFNLPYLEKYNYELAQTGHNFYLWTEKFPGNWSYSYLSKPDNFYHLPNQQRLFDHSIDYDAVICHGRLGQMAIAHNIAHGWHLPLFCVHHEILGKDIIADNGLPAKIVEEKRNEMLARQGHINVSSSQEIGMSWNVIGPVINIGINTKTYSPTPTKSLAPYKCLWEPTQDQGLNNFIVSNLSSKVELIPLQASMNEAMLISQYHSCHFYLNLDGLSANINVLKTICCGLIPISVANSNFTFIKYMVKNLQELSSVFESIKNMSNEQLQTTKMAAIEDGRQMSNPNFVSQWNGVLQESSNFIYQR